MKLLLTLLAVSVCAASAVVCPLYCNLVACFEVTPEICAEQNAVLMPNATLCGCCHACIITLSMIIIAVIIIIIIIVININNFVPF